MSDVRPEEHAPIELPEAVEEGERVTPLRPIPGRPRPGRSRSEPVGGGAAHSGRLVSLPESDRTPGFEDSLGRVPLTESEASRRPRSAESEIADLELRLSEQEEIEKIRNLEIRRLEQELEEKNTRIVGLELDLFHAERRGDDLDRRWNELAETYEETKARLVEAGALLEAIHAQAGYGLMLSLGRLLARHPVLHAAVRRLARWTHTRVPS